MSSDDRGDVVKRMSDLMRSGAVMLEQTCPLCGLPLFRLRSGEVVCPVHGAVKIVKSEDEAVEAVTSAVLREFEKVIARKLNTYINALAKEEGLNSSELKDVIYLLDILERIRRMRRP
ncbi:MAG: Sjogren's syndrome/scleroderma autoantigen 1 family protein [Zestosphaera sp.]